MRCEICQHENHIVGCPYYEGKHLSHCDVCGEFIYEGEKYLENNGGDLVHLECIQRREAIERDIKKNEYCDKNNILLYRMQVPFVNYRKWSYQDYYRYINTELKEFVNLARSKEC